MSTGAVFGRVQRGADRQHSVRCQARLDARRVHVRRLLYLHNNSGVKGKVIPYSLPSVGPGADPGVQAVSPQVT